MGYLMLNYHYARYYYLAFCSAANAPQQMQDRPSFGRLAVWRLEYNQNEGRLAVTWCVFRRNATESQAIAISTLEGFLASFWWRGSSSSGSAQFLRLYTCVYSNFCWFIRKVLLKFYINFELFFSNSF
jgi:hypothetical protein